jgi:HEAT repeat protein
MPSSPLHRVAGPALLVVLAAAALGDGKGSGIGGPPSQSDGRRPQSGANADQFTDAEKEARFKTIAKEYEDLKRNQDVLQTRKRRNLIRFVGTMRYPPSAKFLEAVFNGDRDVRTQANAMVAVGQTGDLATIQSVVKTALANAKKDPVFAAALPRMFREVTNPEAGKWLVTRLEGRDADTLPWLVEAVGASGTKEAAPPLLDFIDKGKDVVLRFEAMRAYGRCAKVEAVSKLFNMLADTDWRIRMGAAEGLRFAGDPRAISELKRLIIESEEPIVAETAVEAVGELGLVGEGTKEAIPPLLDALHVGRMRCREKARQYMIKLAKKIYRQTRDYSVDHEAWARWFEKAQHGYDPDDPNFAKHETSSFFRFSVQSDCVLYILDVSGSMDWPGAPKGVRDADYSGRRIDLARRELFKSIDGLSKDTRFNVAVFSGAVMAWQKADVEASKENRAAAIDWVRKQLPRGGTATYDAIDFGISRTKADTIYFLSDGVPSGGRFEEPETILMELRKANRFRRVSINTVALIVGKADYESVLKYEDPDEMAEFMARIATENYGQFQDESHP